MKLRLNPIALAMMAAQLLFYPAIQGQAATLVAYSPQNNDGGAGKIQLSSGSETLSGNQAFISGTDGAVTTTLGQVMITSGSQYINQDRLDPGPQNFAIKLPDIATGGNTTFPVYNSASLIALAPVTASTRVPDVRNVKGDQYINARVADVSGGTLEVNIGQANAASSASTNSWSMAAKQTQLFDVSGSGTLNWNSNNRIGFFGAAAVPDSTGTTSSRYQVQNLATYHGPFQVRTLDGSSTNFTVTNPSQLQTFNNWLISQLQRGNLDKTRYLTEFNKAVTFTSASINYTLSATPPDEVTQPIGNRIVINANGAGSRVNLAAGKTLEVTGATGGAIRAANGAQAVIDGKLASRDGNNSGSALLLTNGSRGINNGVVNGGFLNHQDGTGVGSTGYGSSGVSVQSGSRFDNNAIVNFATTGSNSRDGVAGINLGADAAATNSGNINVGINGSSARGTASGVLLTAATSTFTNGSSGNITIGQGPQNRLGEAAAATAMNQSGLTSGIALIANGSAVNNGSITIGSRTQNAAGMSVTGAKNASMINTGVIDVNGAAAAVPRENIGMAVTDSRGIIKNRGTINLNGVNGSGMKVLATEGNRASAISSGTINVAGGADPASGTRNYGVWVEGQGTGLAQATLNGPVNLRGNGAIGVHARGNAVIDVGAAAIPSFATGSNQIAFFAYGPNARINVASPRPLNVTSRSSTLFRVEQGAIFNAGALSLVASGADSTAVLGSGNGTKVNTGTAAIDVSGAAANGVTIEGGAKGVIGADTRIKLTGPDTIGAIVDGQKHTLTGSDSGSAVDSTSLNTSAALNSAQRGLIGYLARNGARLSNSGNINFSGGNATGIKVESGATLVNNGKVDLTGPNSIGVRARSGSTITSNGMVQVADGIGLDLAGSSTTLAKGGVINVDNGIAGIRISEGAQLALRGNATRVISSGTAHGILLDKGAGSFSATDAIINVNGSGNGIENRAELSNLNLSNLRINLGDGSGIRTAVALDPNATVTSNVNGSGNGFNLVNADGTAISGDLTLGSGYLFNVKGAGGNAIRVNTSGNVVTAASVNINNAAGGSALISSKAGYILNTGSFTSNSLTAPVVDLQGGQSLFENRGAIIAASPASVAVAGSKGDDGILLTAGSVLGDISTDSGSDIFRWTGGKLNGSLTMGDGDNNQAEVSRVDLSTTRHLSSGAGTGNSLTFNNIDARGGSFSADDLSKGVNLGSGWSTLNFNDSRWTLTDNLRLARGEININSGSTLYAGNRVAPTLAGAGNHSLVVNNAGILDLTNGSGSPGNRLNIDGSLASQGGQLNLTTRLNAGGALSNQFTDHLNVLGNASGNTLVKVTVDPASRGGLTDRNRSGSVEANEGISLVQVAGNGNAQSFSLADGELVAGPWRYQLYSFAPGASDADQRLVSGNGNNYWDYRLANEYVCRGEASCSPQVTPVTPGLSHDSRPAVVPQIPSYISAPVGLAYYTAAVIDDLHKRLGELRHEQARAPGEGGEMFVRYIGSDLNYQSDRAFRDYGYDFDLNYSAVQLGGNLLRLDGDKDSLRGGVAYTRGNARLHPKAADGYSTTGFDSDSLALYGTWQRQNGFYLDGVLSFDWHRGTTDTARQHDMAKLKGHGWTTSLESGYPIELINNIKLEPQAQLIYMKLSMSDFVDNDGNKVSYDNYSQTIGRLGARLERSWTDQSNRQFTPYLRANYYKGWGGTAKTSISSVDNPSFAGSFNSGNVGQMWELGAGATATLPQDVSLYAEANYRQALDDNGAKGWRYNVGVRWQF